MNCAVENLMTLEELLHSVAGKLIDGFNGDFIFTSVVTDSRAVVFGSLFIPLIGEKQNGHLYIEQAIQN
ncbi:MAG: UDP-N-acetylmuramoyl-tripeptide--D-alanyl-D-alanine ligase, partial [Treponema sp.]